MCQPWRIHPGYLDYYYDHAAQKPGNLIKDRGWEVGEGMAQKEHRIV